MLEDIYEKGRKKIEELSFSENIGNVETGFVGRHNREIFKHFHLVMAGIGAKTAELQTSVLGVDLDSPVMMASIAHPIPQITENALMKMARGLKETGSMMWVGATVPQNLEELAEAVPLGLMIKPFGDRNEIFKRIEMAEAAGAVAYGVDYDSAAGTKYGGKLHGYEPASPLSREEIEDIKEASDLPFVLKGVLSEKDAKSAEKADVEHLVVTNHGAHTLDYLPHPLEVLPEIIDIVGDDKTLLVDSGFRRGSDVFKGLAFGADAIMLGRPLLYGLAADGQSGVEEVLNTIAGELKRIMTMCGAERVRNVDESMVTTCKFP